MRLTPKQLRKIVLEMAHGGATVDPTVLEHARTVAREAVQLLDDDGMFIHSSSDVDRNVATLDEYVDAIVNEISNQIRDVVHGAYANMFDEEQFDDEV